MAAPPAKRGSTMPSSITNELSDAELLQAMLLGARNSWALFLRRYDAVIHASINRILRRFPGLCREVEREEVRALLLSSLLANDMHKLRAFDAERGTSLTSWITLLATRATWDHLRVLARAPSFGAQPELHEHEHESAGPLASLIVREEMSRMRFALDQLSSRDQRLVELLFLSPEPPHRVANAMRISIATVYTKRHKLKLRLRKVMLAPPPRVGGAESAGPRAAARRRHESPHRRRRIAVPERRGLVPRIPPHAVAPLASPMSQNSRRTGT